MKSLPSQQDAVAKVWTTDQSCGKSNFLIWNQIKIVNKWSQIKSKSCPSQIHIKSNPSFTTNQIFLSWFVNLNQIKIFLLAFLLMHWTKLEHKVKAGFEYFEKYQKSQNKLEASQRTLTVCGSCGTPLPLLTLHVTECYNFHKHIQVFD